MKVDKYDAWDRLGHLKKTQSKGISETCQEILDSRPFGHNPFYIFAHARTGENHSVKRLVWQPRLTKPKAQTNSMLFKGYPGTDMIKVIWIIPDRMLWPQYQTGNVTESGIVQESIYAFINERDKLEAKEPDDLSDKEVDRIYQEISMESIHKTTKRLIIS